MDPNSKNTSLPARRGLQCCWRSGANGECICRAWQTVQSRTNKHVLAVHELFQCRFQGHVITLAPNVWLAFASFLLATGELAKNSRAKNQEGLLSHQLLSPEFGNIINTRLRPQSLSGTYVHVVLSDKASPRNNCLCMGVTQNWGYHFGAFIRKVVAVGVCIGVLLFRETTVTVSAVTLCTLRTLSSFRGCKQNPHSHFSYHVAKGLVLPIPRNDAEWFLLEEPC